MNVSTVNRFMIKGAVMYFGIAVLEGKLVSKVILLIKLFSCTENAIILYILI